MCWKQTVVVTAAVAFLSSCQLIEDAHETKPLRGKILFRVYEETYSGTVEPHDPYTVIVLQTEYEYECYNYQLSYNFGNQNNTLEFTVYDAYIGGLCQTALGPAKLYMPINLPAGEYELIIRHEGITDAHVILVTDSSIVQRSADTSISRPVDTLYWRVPRKSFYYHCYWYADVNDGWVCDAFLDTLRNLAYLTERHRPDQGRWPYPTETYFTYLYESDYDSVGVILKRFTKQYLTYERSASIFLTNWRQKRFTSAAFRNE